MTGPFACSASRTCVENRRQKPIVGARKNRATGRQWAAFQNRALSQKSASRLRHVRGGVGGGGGAGRGVDDATAGSAGRSWVAVMLLIDRTTTRKKPVPPPTYRTK